MSNLYKISFAISGILLLAACGGSDTSAPIAKPITPPTDVTTSSIDGQILIDWTLKASEQYDLYVSTEAEFDFNNYASYDNGEWIKNITPPYTYKPSDYSQVYFFAVVAKTENQESEQSSIVSSIPRYVDNGDYVLDLNTELTWDKCSVGQSWDSAKNTCVGEIQRMSYDQAKQYASSIGSGWRLPEFAELTTIIFCKDGKPHYFLTSIEEKCMNPDLLTPTIYESIFPKVSIDTNYLTNTQHNLSSPSPYRFYKTVSFKIGGFTGNVANEPTWQAVRLVKDTK